MINSNRIVPVAATDLLSLYGVILKMDSNNSSLAAVQAATVEGDFEITSASTPLLLAEPAKTINFGASVSSATVYFVAAYDYKGFSLNGTAVTPTGTVKADGNTLYVATLSTGAVTVAKVGL